MASPVNTSVKYLHSGMTGAPVLRGQAGSLIALLDACLKDGFGLQVASSLIVSNGVATLTVPSVPSALVGSVILVAGASISALNGEQKVTAVGANTIQFATTASNGTATGAISVKMAPLGFTKPFSGTNLAVYKPSDLTANGNYLQVDDTNAMEARAVGYETMTELFTGTGLFPTAAQLSGGVYWGKSLGATSIAVPWILVGDSRFFYLLNSVGVGGDASYADWISPVLCAWGDPVGFGMAPDPYSTVLIGRPDGGFASAYSSLTLTSTYYPAYCARDVLSTGTAVTASLSALCQGEADSGFDRVSGRIIFSSVVARTNLKASLRFSLPGINLSLNRNVEVVISNKSSFYAGSPEKSYLGVYVADASVNVTGGYYLAAFNITGPWR